MWTVKHIFDGDYGCEERSEDASPMVTVTLEDENGELRYERVEDAA